MPDTTQLFARLDAAGADTAATTKRFMGDSDAYASYLASFPDEPTMGQLEQAVADKDWTLAERSVHSLKGVAGNLGLLPLYDASVDMLEELRDGEIDEALDCMDDVRATYTRMVEAVRGV